MNTEPTNQERTNAPISSNFRAKSNLHTEVISTNPQCTPTVYSPLPDVHTPFADKYFLRSREILEKEGLNPWVRAQVFIRKGPGQVFGINEAVEILEKYGQVSKHGGRIFAKRDGDSYSPKESLMIIEAPIQSIVELETMYLGVLSAATTCRNTQIEGVDLERVTRNMASVVAAADGRPVVYFGARHWDFRMDEAIARAAYEGGAVAASSDAGARTFGANGVGTIPHALENIYAYYKGRENAVLEATLAFDRHMDPSIPRVALVDYNNKELDDALATARALPNLTGVRLDTHGDNVAQGGLTHSLDTRIPWFTSRHEMLPASDHPDAKYWYGKGVTFTGAYSMRTVLNQTGRADKTIMLTSGFADEEKVRAFGRAEERMGLRVYNSLGVGGVFPSWAATMDITHVSEEHKDLDFNMFSKLGRPAIPNPTLSRLV